MKRLKKFFQLRRLLITVRKKSLAAIKRTSTGITGIDEAYNLVVRYEKLEAIAKKHVCCYDVLKIMIV